LFIYGNKKVKIYPLLATTKNNVKARVTINNFFPIDFLNKKISSENFSDSRNHCFLHQKLFQSIITANKLTNQPTKQTRNYFTRQVKQSSQKKTDQQKKTTLCWVLVDRLILSQAVKTIQGFMESEDLL
jgi:hypothetical protein